MSNTPIPPTMIHPLPGRVEADDQLGVCCHSSVFWHQINTHRLRVTSNYLLCDVLRLPREAKTVRYLRPWTIFLLSGLLHIAVDMSSGRSLLS